MRYILIVITSIIVLAPSCPSKSPEYYFQEGEKLYKSGSTELAVKYYTKAIKDRPDYMEAYMSRAKANMSIDSIHNAMADYDTLIVRMLMVNDYQKLGEVYFLKGDAHFLLSQDSLACKYYRKSRNMNNSKSWDRLRKRCK